MASEALYAGLAAGGNELASIMREKRKAELEERLMREREAAADRREEARAARAEARELKKTTRSEYNPLTGVITEYNSENTALRERPASHAEVFDYTNKQRTSELNLEKLSGELADAEWERGEGRQMKLEAHRADIDATKARADASRASAAYSRSGRSRGDEDDSPSLADMKQEALRQYGSYFGEYTDAEGEPLISKYEQEQIVEEALKDAASRGISDFGGVLSDILAQRYGYHPGKKPKIVTPTKSGTTTTSFADQGR